MWFQFSDGRWTSECGWESRGGLYEQEAAIYCTPLVYPRKLDTLSNLVRSDKATPIYPGPGPASNASAGERETKTAHALGDVGRSSCCTEQGTAATWGWCPFIFYTGRPSGSGPARRPFELSGTTRNDTEAGGTIPRKAGGRYEKPIEGWRRDPVPVW